MRIRGQEMLVFWKIFVRTKLMAPNAEASLGPCQISLIEKCDIFKKR